MHTIRTTTPADANTLARIGRISFLESHAHSAPAADIESCIARKYAVETITAELANPANIYHLIYYNELPAGYSKITLNTLNENIPAQKITCLDRLYLLREFYDLKLGLKLFEHNLNISKQAGQSGVWLQTWTENKRAIAFYQKAGFKIIGKVDFQISNTHANPNHVMYLETINQSAMSQ